MKRVVVIGAGISGLTLAWRLEQLLPQDEVLVLEAEGRPGGKIGTHQREGFRVETGPNGFLDSKPNTRQLCRELGLEDRLAAASEAAGKHRYLLLGGALRELPSSLWSFLTSDLLSWRSKLSLVTERFRRSRRPEGDESIHDFVARRTSPEVAATLADAFVTGIFAGSSRELSVRAAFPRLDAFEREHGSVMKGMAAAGRQRRAEARASGQAPARGGRMWSFREGLGLLVDTLTARLRRQPLVGASACHLRQDPLAERPWVVQGEGHDSWSADAIALTCPADQQALLLDTLDAHLAEQVGAIPYHGVTVVGLGYRAADVPGPLEGFGYLTPGSEGRDVLGVQWCSSIFPDRAPPGMVLLRALCGGRHRPDVLTWDDDRLLGAVRADLRQAMRIEATPVFHHIVRWERAIPQYNLGHLERLGQIEYLCRRHHGLYLGGNCYRGVAMNDCVEQSTLLAQRIAGDLRAG